MQNKKLKASLMAVYSVIVIIIIVAAAAVYFSAKKVDRSLNTYTKILLQKDYLVDRFRFTSNLIQAKTINLVFLSNAPFDSTSIATINNLEDQNGKRLDSLSSITLGNIEGNILENLRSARLDYNTKRKELIHIAQTRKNASLSYYLKTVVPSYTTYQQNFDLIERSYFAENHNRSLEISKFVSASIKIINFLLVLAVIIIIALGRILWLAFQTAIDAQKVAENREIQFEKLLDASPDALIVVNKSGEIVFANDKASALFQYKQEELLTSKIELIIPHGLANLVDIENETKSKELHYTSAKQNTHNVGIKKDGSDFAVEISLNKFETDQGEVILNTIRDISEKKKYEINLEKSEKFNSGILNSLSSHIAVIDENGKIAAVNEAWNNFYKSNLNSTKDVNTGIGANYFEVCQRAIQDGDASAQIVLDGLIAVLHKEQPVFYFEYPCHTISDQRWFAMRAVQFVGDNPMVVISHQDITERIIAVNESKILANQIFEISSSVPGAVYQFKMNTDGTFSFPYISKGFLSLTGLNPEDVYKDSSLAFANVDSEDVFGLMESIYLSAQNMTPWLYVFRMMQNSSKQIKWIRGNSIPSKMGDGSIVWNGTMIDITDVKIIEEQLLINNKELKKTNDELDRFVYSTSHDLRAPLTSVLGLLDIITEDSEDISTIAHVEMVRGRILRLDAYIKNILNYSKNNRTEIQIEVLNLEEIIKNAITLQKNFKLHSDIAFSIYIKKVCPLYSDINRLSMVIDNMISNALKYHKDKSSERYVKISAEISTTNCIIRIEDNGIGIDPIHHEKIFDMFYRISGNTPGAGIGLYLVKEIAEKLEGSISVESIPDKSTTFIIKIKNYLP